MKYKKLPYIEKKNNSNIETIPIGVRGKSLVWVTRNLNPSVIWYSYLFDKFDRFE
tara:strand:- start:22 stop:186 length:165 start_codon:yes stop_codon:yes gene_type:complete